MKFSFHLSIADCQRMLFMNIYIQRLQINVNFKFNNTLTQVMSPLHSPEYPSSSPSIYEVLQKAACLQLNREFYDLTSASNGVFKSEEQCRYQ